MPARGVSVPSWALFLVPLALSACLPSPTQTQQYELHGQILAVRPEADEVLIKHEDIDKFMPGMTMPFKVRDGRLLEGKTPGDLIRARLVVGPEEAWLASIERTGHAPLESSAAMPAASFAVPVGVGDVPPATTLTDQDGHSFSLDDWRGSAVVVTFIYVRCPLPQFCPMMDRRFVELQKLIHSDRQLADRSRLLSVSFDPDHDSPASLRAHAAGLAADPQLWRFATAERDVIDRFAAAFGVSVIRDADRSITHNLRTAVIGPDGRIVAAYSGGDWTTTQITDDLRNSLAR
jgi:protein SCO1/2